MVNKNGLGIVLEVYNSGSLKQSAQEKRGSGIRRRVVAYGMLPKLAKLPQNKRQQS